jgi:hypothetical protein
MPARAEKDVVSFANPRAIRCAAREFTPPANNLGEKRKPRNKNYDVQSRYVYENTQKPGRMSGLRTEICVV